MPIPAVAKAPALQCVKIRYVSLSWNNVAPCFAILSFKATSSVSIAIASFTRTASNSPISPVKVSTIRNTRSIAHIKLTAVGLVWRKVSAKALNSDKISALAPPR